MNSSVLLRCLHCKTINRVIRQKLTQTPICGTCKKPLQFPDQPVYTDTLHWKEEVFQEPGLVLLVFWAPWCGYCRALEPFLNQLAKSHSGMVKILKINTQTDSQPAEEFQVRGIPALFLFQGGKKISEKSGMMSLEALRQWIETSL